MTVPEAGHSSCADSDEPPELRSSYAGAAEVLSDQDDRLASLTLFHPQARPIGSRRETTTPAVGSIPPHPMPPHRENALDETDDHPSRRIVDPQFDTVLVGAVYRR